MHHKLRFIGIFIIILLTYFQSYSNDNKQIIVDKSQKDNVIPFNVRYKIAEYEQNRQISSPLSISSRDILWEFGKNGEYVDMIIRKKWGIRSVLLTNMYYGDKFIKDYGDKAYGLRSRKYNYVNGNEVRYVHKGFVGKRQHLFFLVDSNPERHSVFGWAFRIRIPRVVEFGYKTAGENFGILTFEKGITINLRTYARKYADHRGKFMNTPIRINLSRDEYNEKMKPSIIKLKEYYQKNYKVVMVKFTSQIDYIKYFLIRDIYESKYFRKISFTSHDKIGHKTAIVLRAVKKQGGDIMITALIYFKIGSSEKDYDISAIDQKNRVSKTYISTTVKQYTPRHSENRNKSIEKNGDDEVIFDEQK